MIWIFKKEAEKILLLFYGGNAYSGDGYKGFDVGANLTLAKNIVAGVKYSDFESREGNTDKQTIWSEVIFSF